MLIKNTLSRLDMIYSYSDNHFICQVYRVLTLSWKSPHVSSKHYKGANTSTLSNALFKGI